MLKRVTPRTRRIETTFSHLGHSPPPTAIDFLGLFGFRTPHLPDPSPQAVFYNKTVKTREVLAIGTPKHIVNYSVSTPPETREKDKTRATLRAFASFSASQTKTQNLHTCFLTENTVQGSVFTPSDTNKTANQLAPVDLKGGPPRPQFDKPAEFVEKIVKDISFVKD